MDEDVILTAKDTSDWLKQQIRETKERENIFECLNDLELLRVVLETRLNKIQMRL